MKLGFIGTGNITVAVVNGICGSKILFKKILVSSRNKGKALKLSKKFTKVSIAKTNQEIILKNQYSDLSLEKLVVDTESDLKQINFKVSQIDKMPWQIHYTDF